MQTVAEYFARPDSPQPNPPVGTLMLKVLEKYPDMGLEAARAKANELLAISAKGKVYRTRAFSRPSNLSSDPNGSKRHFGSLRWLRNGLGAGFSSFPVVGVTLSTPVRHSGVSEDAPALRFGPPKDQGMKPATHARNATRKSSETGTSDHGRTSTGWYWLHWAMT